MTERNPLNLCPKCWAALDESYRALARQVEASRAEAHAIIAEWGEVENIPLESLKRVEALITVFEDGMLILRAATNHKEHA